MLSLAHLFRRTMATNSSRSLIAVCQMTSDKDLQENFKTCKSMIERASERKCKMVFFPECFDFIAGSKEDSIKLAMGENCEFIGQFRQLAKQHGIWLSLGGLHHQDNKVNPLPSNTHLVIDSDGVTKACYKKLHLFDLEIPGKVRLKESEFSKSGVLNCEGLLTE